MVTVTTAKGCTLRLLREADIADLVQATAEKTAALGMAEPFWLPPLRERRTKKVFVFEKEGAVVGALVFREVTEMIVAGNDPMMLRDAVRHELEIREVLARADVDNVVAWVPEQIARGMRRIMERCGFSRIEGMMSFETTVEPEVV